MNRNQQKRFVKDLSSSITKSICDLIAAGKIPGNWDGHELRCYLALRHEQSAVMTQIRSNPHRKRARDYRNTVLMLP